MLDDVLPHNCSIAAVNDAGDILAIRLAQIKAQDQWLDWIMDNVFKIIFTSKIVATLLLGEEVGNNTMVVSKLFDMLGYDIWKVMAKLKCNKIYEDKAVCSARFHGIKGLGTEIVKRSEELALELGCTHTFAVVTGEISLL